MDEFLNNEPHTNISPRAFNEAWVQYILEFPLTDIKEPEIAKRTIVKMLYPVINTGARSNLRRPDVRLFLWEYDNIWRAYFVYKRKGNYDPDLLLLKRTLRSGFALMLYRSIEMRQMGMILEPKQNIFQRFVSGTQQKLGFFKTKKPKNMDNMNMEE